MNLLTMILISLVVVLHVYFLILEMFLWTRPLGMKTFRLKPEFAQATKVLAMNQGLYNGFLAAGLLWGLLAKSNAVPISIFFLSCVIVAGLFGGITANKKIITIQALPAMLAMTALLIS